MAKLVILHIFLIIYFKFIYIKKIVSFLKNKKLIFKGNSQTALASFSVSKSLLIKDMGI